jgi:hypothetical protein
LLQTFDHATGDHLRLGELAERQEGVRHPEQAAGRP